MKKELTIEEVEAAKEKAMQEAEKETQKSVEAELDAIEYFLNASDEKIRLDTIKDVHEELDQCQEIDRVEENGKEHVLMYMKDGSIVDVKSEYYGMDGLDSRIESLLKTKAAYQEKYTGKSSEEIREILISEASEKKEELYQLKLFDNLGYSKPKGLSSSIEEAVYELGEPAEDVFENAWQSIKDSDFSEWLVPLASGAVVGAGVGAFYTISGLIGGEPLNGETLTDSALFMGKATALGVGMVGAVEAAIAGVGKVIDVINEKTGLGKKLGEERKERTDQKTISFLKKYGLYEDLVKRNNELQGRIENLGKSSL